MADDVTISIRTRGGRQAARDVDSVRSSVTKLGPAARSAGRELATVGKNARSMASSGLGVVTNQAKYAALGLAGVGVVAVKSGLEFNASMEQNQVAFTNFLGSAGAARQELAWLQKAAMTTPFDLPGIVSGERQLLAYGFTARQSRGYLMSVADAAAGAGLGADKINDMIRVIGQIRGKGKLFTEELQQLGELGVINRPAFAKNLGITEGQLADAGAQGIGADKALRALQKTLNDSFGGASAKQAKTFNGQMSNLRDNLNQTLGVITKPGFDLLRTKILPAANDAAGQIKKIFDRDDLSLDQKIKLSRGVAHREFGPFVRDAGHELEQLHLGDKLSAEFERQAPRIADAAGRMAVRASGAFVRAWFDAGPYGKLFTLAVLGSKLGVFTALGRLAAARFRTSWARNRGTVAPPTVLPPVVSPGGGGLPGEAGKAGKAGKFRGALSKAGKLAGIATIVPLAADVAFGSTHRKAKDLGNRMGHALGDVLGTNRQHDTIKPIHLPTDYGSRRRPRAAAPARTRGRDIVIHNHTHLNGREIARNVKRVNADDKARR